MSELVLLREGEMAPRASEIRSAIAHVEQLLARLAPLDASSELTDARAKAEAAELWARRTRHGDDERHFGKLRLLAEAGLGVLELNGYDVDPDHPDRVKHWTVLAAAFERGQLLACCEDGTSLRDVTREVRRRGWTLVPRHKLPEGLWTGQSSGPRQGALAWRSVRKLCFERGVDVRSLPPDPEAIVRESANRAQAAHLRAVDARAHREWKRRQRIARSADPEIKKVYGFIREALGALDSVPSNDLPAHRKTALNESYSLLYRAEDLIAKAFPERS